MASMGSLGKIETKKYAPMRFLDDYYPIYDIVIDDSVSEWEFPYDRFIQYEQSDRWWAEKWGFGHKSSKPVAYQTNGKLICNQEFIYAYKVKVKESSLWRGLIEYEGEFKAEKDGYEKLMEFMNEE